MIYPILFSALTSTSPALSEKPCALTYQISRNTGTESHNHSHKHHNHRQVTWQQINKKQQLITENDPHQPQYLATFADNRLYELKVAYPEINRGVQFFYGDLKTIGLHSFKSLMMQQLNIKNPNTNQIEKQDWQGHTVEYSKISNPLKSIALKWHSKWQWPVDYLAQQAALSYHVKLTNHQMTQCEQAAPDWENIDWMDFSDLGDNEADDFAKQFINMGHSH